ncbi:hypothetical protein O3G_MSEX005505 [Manduca sexta]|uniref:DRBM domain-containing protein n=1 Tax=Manduca sexta TaxID=7130 RepID=A0A921YZ86_MANSE|nr:hypothetical protein O3G_MSEX005505 [Manduca sexta]
MSEENQDMGLPPAKKQKIDSDEQVEEGERVDSPKPEETLNKCPISEDKYMNFVTREELEKLREFKVLDEVRSNDEDSNDDDSSSSDGIPEDEIERMLEEDLPEGFKGTRKPREKVYVTRQKIVLEEKVVDQFEILPLDWMMVRHYSGMPIYMHRATRVCTLSKPYFLGKGNTRRHEIPISAIPCYAYRRALEEEEKQREIDKKIEEQIRSGAWLRNYNKAKAANNKTNENGNSTNNENNDSNKNNVVVNSENNNDDNNGNENEVVVDCHNENNTNTNEDNNATVENINGYSNESNNTTANENGVSNDVTIDGMTNNVNSIDVDNNKSNIEDTTEPADKKHPVTKESDDTKENDNTQSNQTGTQSKKCPFNHNSEKPEEEEKTIEEIDIPLNRQPVVLPGGIVMPPPKVETVNTSWKSQHLTAEQVNNYCKKLFKFKTVNIMLFKRWADRRKYTKARKALQYPTLPEGTKLITIPANPNATSENGGSKAMKRDWVMNMDGRSYLSVFHEYVRRALQKQPVYEFKQLENAATPYQATVYIGGMQYGVGHGSSKRQAKSAAARASVHILIPEMKDELDAHMGHAPAHTNEPDFTFFDYVGIEDPRIAEFCAAACEPSPHAILRTCLLRNFGAGDWHIHTEMKKLEYQKIELTMKVGKHTATAVCKNKKTAKQRASQSILQALHPHVRSWGSLLRLYGLRSVKSCKEKKIEEQEITLLQDKAQHNEPNYAVLEKLRNEMRKLRERDEAVMPIGTLLLTDDLPTHSASNLNNIDL